MKTYAVLLLMLLLSCGQNKNFSPAQLKEPDVVTTGFIERNSSFLRYSASAQLEDSTGNTFAVYFFIDSIKKSQNLMMLFVEVLKPEPSKTNKEKSTVFSDTMPLTVQVGCPSYLMDSTFSVLHIEFFDLDDEVFISKGTIDFLEGNYYGIAREVHPGLVDVEAKKISKLPPTEYFRSGNHFYLKE